MDGQPHGAGTLTLPEGTYEGEFQGGKFHGYGVFSYANGDVCSCSWVEDQQQGQGSYTWVQLLLLFFFFFF